MRIFWCFGLPGLACLFAACVSGPILGDLPEDDGTEGGISEVPNPSPKMAASSGTPLATLQHGHEVYMLKCGECHAYMIPDDLFEDEWQDAMPRMIRHAGLPSQDEKDVLAYVMAVKKEE